MRIVIVDSEETSREVIKQAINTVVETHKIKSGCKIVGEAADGRKGCEIIVKERPDLIIMDLELPGKNGLPLLKKIRSGRKNLKKCFRLRKRRINSLQSRQQNGIWKAQRSWTV